MNRGLNTIKAVVIGLGLAIVAVTIILVMAAIDKAGETTRSDEPVLTADAYADVAVALPAGARAMAMAGGGDALSLLVVYADGSQTILTVDRRSGEVLGTLELLPRNP